MLPVYTLRGRLPIFCSHANCFFLRGSAPCPPDTDAGLMASRLAAPALSGGSRSPRQLSVSGPAAAGSGNLPLCAARNPSRIYLVDGQLIDEIGNRRDLVNYEDIPQRLIDALIATEDVRLLPPRR